MLRGKYWFAVLNTQIDTAYTQHTKLAKMMKLLERPWETVEIDFCEPFPSKEYALVITDQYSSLFT